MDAKLIELASEINESMPKYVVSKIAKVLRQHNKTIGKANILIIGVTYKRDVADVRESPSVKIIEYLQQHGCEINYHYPYVFELTVNGTRFPSKVLDLTLISQSDCVVIVTDHSDIDYALIAKYENNIVDTRNAITKRNSTHLCMLDFLAKV